MSNNVIVEREKGLVELERRIAELRQASAAQPLDMSAEIGALEQKYQQILHELFGTLSPWEKVHMARHPARPTSLDYIARFDRFDELHGDRHFRDDPSIVGGFAFLRSRPVMVVGQQRGRDTKENLRRNFGMPAPEGYRKTSRLARLAARLGMPIVTFVDTKGADPGISSEEHAQSEAIATCSANLCDGPRSDRRNDRRRRRIGRSPGAGDRRSRRDARTQHLFGRLARGMCGDSLVGREQGGRSGGAVEVDRR